MIITFPCDKGDTGDSIFCVKQNLWVRVKCNNLNYIDCNILVKMVPFVFFSNVTVTYAYLVAQTIKHLSYIYLMVAT